MAPTFKSAADMTVSGRSVSCDVDPADPGVGGRRKRRRISADQGVCGAEVADRFVCGASLAFRRSGTDILTGAEPGARSPADANVGGESSPTVVSAGVCDLIRRRNRTPASSNPEIESFIAEGSVFEGDLILDRGARIDGRVVGRIQSTAPVVVGPTGVLEVTELLVPELHVTGVVQGRLFVEERVEIHPGGRIDGRLSMPTPGLVMFPGGVFHGELDLPPIEGVDEPAEMPVAAAE